MSEWYDNDDALTTARKRAKWDEDAAAIAQAQDRIADLEAALNACMEWAGSDCLHPACRGVIETAHCALQKSTVSS